MKTLVAIHPLRFDKAEEVSTILPMASPDQKFVFRIVVGTTMVIGLGYGVLYEYLHRRSVEARNETASLVSSFVTEAEASIQPIKTEVRDMGKQVHAMQTSMSDIQTEVPPYLTARESARQTVIFQSNRTPAPIATSTPQK